MARRTSILGSIAEALAERETRAWVHAGLLLLGASVAMFAQLRWQVFQSAPPEVDKAMHYHAGRIVATIAFYVAYVSVVVRVVLVGKEGGGLTGVLLWVPAMIAMAFFAALLITFGIGAVKEALDLSGQGSAEWLDLDATLEGAFTIAAPVAVIMALTPMLIPLDSIMRLPAMFRQDVSTGLATLDAYTRAREKHEANGSSPQVLLLEDDIVCATTVLNFCANLELGCHHVSTVSQAENYLRENSDSVAMVILDNFVRVDPRGDNRTGADWLAQLDNECPKATRVFKIVVISGHIEFLGDRVDKADLVMQKPWEARRLARFMEEHGLTQ